MVKCKLLNRRKRPLTDGLRLNDEELDKLNKVYSFTLEGCCDPLGFNGGDCLQRASDRGFGVISRLPKNL